MGNLTVRLNAKGIELAEELKRAATRSTPVLLIGEKGMGKSVLVRYVCKRVGREYRGVNFTPGMELSTLLGMWRPRAVDHAGITVEWEDGPLTEAAKIGAGFLAEEFFRGPQEMMSRLFNILNNDFRSLEIPERGGKIDVHPNFWFVATTNPVKSGYFTAEADEAMLDRFGCIVEMNDVIVDEAKMLEDIFSENGKNPLTESMKVMAETICKFAMTIRQSNKITISTRSVSQIAKNVLAGETLRNAINRAFLMKLAPDVRLNVEEVMKAFSL